MENKLFRLRRIKAQIKRFSPLLFLVISLGMIFLGISQNPFVVIARDKVSMTVAPVAQIVSLPLSWIQEALGTAERFISTYHENERLREENKLLIFWKTKALQLETEQQELYRLLNYQPPSQAKMVMARVLADNGGVFSQSLILNAGAAQGVRKGAVAMTDRGILGRVVAVGRNTSRVMLITDYLSRLPVSVGNKGFKCILAGDNSPELKLIALPENAEIQVGDVVMTAGTAGVYPAGIGVGTVARLEGRDIIVKPFETQLWPIFIRLVDFGLDDELLQDQPCVCAESSS